jgi:hypothetical protein
MKFLKRAFSWVKAKVGLGFGYIQNHDFIAVQATNHLKNLVRSPILRTGVKLTPTLLDDKALEILEKTALPILEEVCIILGIIRDHEKNSVTVEKLIERIQLLHPDSEAEVYIAYAGRLNHRLADSVLSLQEAIEQAQDTFYTFFKKS